ncbi:MAG: hypothetical protein AB9M53_00575 [Leptothrix sp. (in: b-proteobacteria)]
MSRKRCARRVVVPLPPRGMRPKLANDQVLDLSLCHALNLDAIAMGTADEPTLWDWIGSVLTWSKVAEMLDLGVDEMTEQVQLTKRLIDRYGRTGRIAFTGPDYQLAKQGLDVMDQLATRADRATACIAADWSEARVHAMANPTPQTPA